MLLLFETPKLIQLFGNPSRWMLYYFKPNIDWLSELAPTEPTWLDVLHNWQTLIAGTVAFIPACFAAIFVWRQVNDQRKQFLRTQEAASVKSRLRLSRNISHVSRHLDACYDYLISNNFEYKIHTLSDDLLDDILEAAVTSTTSNLAFFRDYVEKLQAYASSCGLYSNLGGEERLFECFKLLGELDVMTDTLYPYARFETEYISKASIPICDIKTQLLHNLRRGKDISGSNLDELIRHKHFDE